MNRKLLVIIVIALAIVACQSPFVFQEKQSAPMSIADALLTPGANGSVQPTPFQPDFSSQNASLDVNSSNQSQANEPAPTPQPTDVPAFSQNRINILILGSDWRPAGGYRTDVIILFSINQQAGTVSMISFPRDLYVYIPGIGDQRINVSQEFGGFDLTAATFEQNFGIHIDYYVLTNFAGFKSLIDTLGGIEINASQGLSDRCDLPQAYEGYCYIDPGYHAFDGQTALWYVRSRYSSSDFDRTRRAQEVLVGIFHKLMSLDAIARAPEIYSIISANLETNLDFSTITSLLPVASKLLSDESRLHHYAIGSAETTGYTVPTSGAMVLLPDYAAINAILNDAFSQ